MKRPACRPAWRANAILLRDAEVVGAKARCDVHDTGAVFRGDEIAQHYAERVAVGRLGMGQ